MTDNNHLVFAVMTAFHILTAAYAVWTISTVVLRARAAADAAMARSQMLEERLLKYVRELASYTHTSKVLQAQLNSLSDRLDTLSATVEAQEGEIEGLTAQYAAMAQDWRRKSKDLTDITTGLKERAETADRRASNLENRMAGAMDAMGELILSHKDRANAIDRLDAKVNQVALLIPNRHGA